jgi:uncharacterized alkaline shock family protein YloU
VSDGVEIPESVLSSSLRAHISHDVIATYVADAALGVAGVAGLVGGSFGSLERRSDPERAARAVSVTTPAAGRGDVDLSVRLLLVKDAAAPDVCRAVDRAVRDYLEAMVAVTVGRVSIVVEAIAGDGIQV